MTVASDPTTIIPTGTWKIDPVWSSVEFSVRKLGLTTIKGRAGTVAGVITGGETPKVEGTVEAGSLTTFDEQRDSHLASADFFDVERYPELRFVSTDVRRDGDEVIVDGELTIKGVTRRVELRGELTGPSPDPWGTSASAWSCTRRSIGRSSAYAGTHRFPAGGFSFPMTSG